MTVSHFRRMNIEFSIIQTSAARALTLLQKVVLVADTPVELSEAERMDILDAVLQIAVSLEGVRKAMDGRGR